MSKQNKTNRSKSRSKGLEPENLVSDQETGDDRELRRTRSGTVLELDLDNSRVDSPQKMPKQKKKRTGKTAVLKQNTSSKSSKEPNKYGKNNNATLDRGDENDDSEVELGKPKGSSAKKSKGSKTGSKSQFTTENLGKTPGKRKSSTINNPSSDNVNAEGEKLSDDLEIDESRPGDGVMLQVEANEDEFSESGESDTGSSESSDNEASSGDLTPNFEEEPKSQKGDRGRKRSHQDTPRSPPRKRDRNDRADANKDLQLLKDNPGLLQLVEEIVEKRMANKSAAQGKKQTKVGNPTQKKGGVLKSPSDTTVYAPALRNLAKQFTTPNTERMLTPVRQGVATMSLNNQISTIGGASADGGEVDMEEDPGLTRDELIRQEARQAVIDAERFKAAATALPRGKSDIVDSGGYDYNLDDQFFHVTCHLESTLVDKIRKGEFVELERLLNKALMDDKKDREERRLDTVSREGQTYLVQRTDKESKITNFRKWDKAFRVYAMIYTEANPSRAAEVMQYIDIIANAATTFVWDNVAQYDYTFRKLMAKHPNRNWGRTCQQMWTIYMKEHNTKSQTQSSGKKSLKEICCWKYNRRRCDKGSACRYEHRCSFCGSYSHVYLECPRKPKKSDQGKKKKENKTDNETSA